ncbi:glutaminase B [Shewanella sp. 202IG2-18]|uniref:glutaminase B n=1 Tax=Parashewanella hymeniacidonis TaxID=2807618 RepID=UPI0019617080|nr:glutaminase B [Parashewanella hymeniacidonis]MBM7073341.1 glutaminase B [Parashewanella hymeniacidonis]
MDSLLSQILNDVKPLVGKGKVADYIPALSLVEAEKFGIAICSNDGEIYKIGDADLPFSIQSISKVFSLILAMEFYGDEIWTRVGHEPSGLPFNSLVQLEHEQGIPRNPFINAGALVVSDMNQSKFAAPDIAMREFLKKLSGNYSIQVDKKIADSEYEHRARNAAAAYLMKSFNNFDNEVEDVLYNYFCNCAIKMSCVDLAKAANFLANKGFSFITGKKVLTENQTSQVNALLATSGLYDEAGSFAFRVGLPGKSGVGGGIVAIVPGQFSICVWSPALNEAGNSLAGMAALESLTKHIGWSVY